jgi:DNA-binding NarL/FixJ family response regulator
MMRRCVNWRVPGKNSRDCGRLAAVRRLLGEEDQLSEDAMRTSFKPCRTVETERIFVVESDEVIRSALQFILKGHIETHGFTNLDQAFAKAAELTPNVLLLGIGFVQDNGERVLAKIATKLPDTRILVVADTIHDPLAKASLKWGAHDVLAKPIAFDSVRCKVDALLGRHEISPALIALLPLSAAW